MFDWLRGKSEAEPASMFGKIPNQPDFVRVRAAVEVVDVFDGWLQASLQKLDSDGLTVGEDPTFFLFSAPSGKHCMLGALKASRDAVGRKFPVAVFSLLDAGRTAKNVGSVIPTYDAFIDELASTLGLTSRMSAGELRSRLDATRPPSQDELDQRASRATDERTATPIGGAFGRLFGQNQEAWSYAMFAFTKAVQPVVGGRPDRPGPTLDCPIRSRADVGFWLTLAEHAAKWKKAPPPVVWREGPQPRMLLTFGLEPPGSLGFLADPSAEDGRLWPMSSTNPDLLRSAQSSLPDRVGAILRDSTSPMSGLLSALGHA